MTATILVVDDVIQNVKLLEAKLTKEYYDVITARNGFEALEQVKQGAIDIILLDVMMPEMDGFECCKRLKLNPQTSHIPIVMVTALNQIEDRVRGLQAGADDFLTKPIKETALLARIRSLVRIKIMLDELRIRNQTGLDLGVSNEFSEESLLKNAKILLIEDDMAQAKQIKNKLSESKAEVEVEHGNFSDIPEKAVKNDYDLIIISTQLIEMDGLRICSQIKSHENTRSIPLLILIEESNEAILIKALDMGVNDYLITPLDSNEIEARVRTQIKRKRYQDALKNQYEQSLNMALIDGLTGLYNRRYFDVHLEQLVEQAKHQNKPLSLMLMDLDHFKQVNDKYGHLVGDEVLKELSSRIKSNIRLTDLPSRYGGEEFTIILPNTDLVETQIVAERIREVIAANPFKITVEPYELKVTISIGVALFDINDTPQALIKKADKALYLAKESGRNKVQS
jgi:two-component system cell cycle response regulator